MERKPNIVYHEFIQSHLKFRFSLFLPLSFLNEFQISVKVRPAIAKWEKKRENPKRRIHTFHTLFFLSILAGSGRTSSSSSTNKRECTRLPPFTHHGRHRITLTFFSLLSFFFLKKNIFIYLFLIHPFSLSAFLFIPNYVLQMTLQHNFPSIKAFLCH